MFKNLCINLIIIYQEYFKGFIPSCCRFQPSCSEYSKQALEKYGFGLGLLKAIQRVLACQPFSKKFSFDPLT